MNIDLFNVNYTLTLVANQLTKRTNTSDKYNTNISENVNRQKH